jgi:hypothetical protein
MNSEHRDIEDGSRTNTKQPAQGQWTNDMIESKLRVAAPIRLSCSYQISDGSRREIGALPCSKRPILGRSRELGLVRSPVGTGNRGILSTHVSISVMREFESNRGTCPQPTVNQSHPFAAPSISRHNLYDCTRRAKTFFIS